MTVLSAALLDAKDVSIINVFESSDGLDSLLKKEMERFAADHNLQLFHEKDIESVMQKSDCHTGQMINLVRHEDFYEYLEFSVAKARHAILNKSFLQFLMNPDEVKCLKMSG